MSSRQGEWRNERERDILSALSASVYFLPDVLKRTRPPRAIE